jgi:hypothetical protein
MVQAIESREVVMKRSSIAAIAVSAACAGMLAVYVAGTGSNGGAAVETEIPVSESRLAEQETQPASFVDTLIEDPVVILDENGKATLDMGGGIKFDVDTTIGDGVIASVDSVRASSQPNGTEILSTEANIMATGGEVQIVSYVKVPGTGTVCLTGMVEL